jgi:hypothetical protein
MSSSAAPMSSLTAASPPVASADLSDSANYTLLYIIVAVLAGVTLLIAIRYGRSLLAEYRQLQAGRGGAARVGLSADEIAALPTFTYRVRASTSSSPLDSSARGDGRKMRSGSKQGMAAVECVVCLQELEDGDVVRVLPACRHFFHGGCIDLWLSAHSSCPVCRAELDPECDRLGEAAVISPPLPQLRRCGVSPERPSSASRVLADILARSPLRSPTPRGYARVDDQWTKPPSPGSLSEIRVVKSKTPSPMRLSSKHLSPSPRSVGVLDSAEVIASPSSAPVVQEIVITRSMTPSPTRLNRQLSPRNIAVVENSVAITTLASPSSMPTGEGGGGSLSKSPSPVHIQ